MNILKQKIYLPTKEDYGIYLGNFLGYPDGYSNVGNLQEQEGYFFTTEQLNEYTFNVIQQTLETAARNVEADFEPMEWLAEQHAESPFIEGEDYEIGISRSSITGVFKEIFKKFKLQ